MKPRVVLAKRAALLKLLEEEQAGAPDPDGTRKEALGSLAEPEKKRTWWSSLGAALGSVRRRWRRS